MDIRQRIEQFERVARRLEPSPEDRSRMQACVLDFGEDFLNRIEDSPVYNATHDHGRALYEFPIGGDPIDIEKAIDLVRTTIDQPALNPASGGHVGYVPGGGVYPSSLGDYMAAVTNTYAGVYFVGPGAVRMEHMCVRWMCDLIGYPASGGGDLTSGGSIANLIAVVSARDARGLKARDFHRAVVYLSPQAHHSLHKSLRLAGMGECVVRHVGLDERFRMQPDALASAIVEDRDAGLLPWLVIAAGGTTDTGAIDPLRELGDIARANELWYHIDAAMGGFFLLCERGRKILDGIDTADSVIMDPHKGLFLPYGTGAVMLKDRLDMNRSHYYQAAYMQDATGVDDEYSPAEFSPELTRHFRGLRMWLPLKLFGLEPFRACLEEKLLLARYFHGEVARLGFETGPDPDLCTSIYRWVPARGDANAFNLEIARRVQNDGRVFITSTTIDNVVWLRMTALCFRTHRARLDMLVEILQRKVHEVEALA